jgi:hypothetical protein
VIFLPKKGTGLGGFKLHFGRRNISGGGMKPGLIIEALDEGKDIALGLGTGLVL